MQGKTYITAIMVILSCVQTFALEQSALREGVIGQYDYAHRVSVVAGKDNRLFVAASVHMPDEQNPLAKVYLWESSDNGKTWTSPLKISETPFDDIGAGLCVTNNGTLLVNYSTSIAWACDPSLERPKFVEWWNKIKDTSLIKAGSYVNFWMRRSEDGGKTWSVPFELPANPLHGIIQLKDGNLFMFGQQVSADFSSLIDGERNLFLMCAETSSDDGRTWKQTKVFAAVYGKGTIETSVHESSFAQNIDGTIVVLTRNNFQGDGTDLYQRELVKGYTNKWPQVHKIGRASSFHIASLKDGRLLISYTTKSEPTKLLAKISADGGKNWKDTDAIISGEKTIRPGFMSAELQDGNIMTVWFDADESGEIRLCYRVWKL